MRFKLDENLGSSALDRFREEGFDVDTVAQEGLAGSTDDAVFEAAKGAGRALITLDLDFASPIRFDPTGSAGVIVFRVPVQPSRAVLSSLISVLLDALAKGEVAGHLWVVGPAGVRQYRGGDSEI